MRPNLSQIWLVTGLLAVYLVLELLKIDPPWLPYLFGFAALTTVVDGVFGFTKTAPKISRQSFHSLALGVWTDITLNLESTSKFIVYLEIFDLLPESFAFKNLPQRIVLPPGRTAIVTYKVKPDVRGDFDFPGCQVRLTSSLGLWSKRITVPTQSSVSVLPNFAPVTKFAMLTTDYQTNPVGIRQFQRRGEGLDFHQLRSYRVGDTFRQIDWKATARARKFITKEYRDEKNQQVIFMLDTGRRMLTREANYSHFDHVLNAMLLLAYVATRQGDSVGFTTFGADPKWIPPRKGNTAIHGLLSHVYRIQPQPVATDYRAAAEYLAVRQKKRALVVIMTNVRDEDNDDLRAALTMLRRHHLVLLASIREQQLNQVLHQPVEHIDDAVMYAATAQYLTERDKAHKSLATPGVIIQDSVWNELAPAITSRYLAIKKAGML